MQEELEARKRLFNTIVKPSKEILPVGLPSFDYFIGGLPKGEITEVSDTESLGKTSFALECVKEISNRGEFVLYFNLEQKINKQILLNRGICLENCIFCSSVTEKDVLEIASELSSEVSLIIVDSLASILNIQENITQDPEYYHFRKTLRTLASIAINNNIPILVLNQHRYFNNPLTPRIPKLTSFSEKNISQWADIRIVLTSGGFVFHGFEPIGRRIIFNVYRKRSWEKVNFSIDLLFKSGFNKSMDLLELSIALGVVKREGAWFFFEEKALGKGKLLASQGILPFYDEILEKIMLDKPKMS